MYDRYYQEFCDEVHKAFGAYLFWRMIQKRSYEDEELLDAMNKTPLSWIITRHSLQVTLFMTLGRVFDVDNDGFSVDDLLKTCINEIDIFSKDRLRQRKIDGQNGNEPDWLDGYIENAYQPTEDDFKRLRGEFAKQRKIFEKAYKPIRHKLFAHNDKDYMGRHDDLWNATNIKELEMLLWSLHDLKQTLFDTYENGRKAELQGNEPDVQFYERDFAALLDRTRNV